MLYLCCSCLEIDGNKSVVQLTVAAAFDVKLSLAMKIFSCTHCICHNCYGGETVCSQLSTCIQQRWGTTVELEGNIMYPDSQIFGSWCDAFKLHPFASATAAMVEKSNWIVCGSQLHLYGKWVSSLSWGELCILVFETLAMELSKSSSNPALTMFSFC